MKRLFDKFICDTGFTGILDVVFLSSTMRIRYADNKDSIVRLKDVWERIIKFCNRLGIVCIEILDVSLELSDRTESPWNKYGFNNRGGIVRYLFLKEDIDMEDLELVSRFIRYKTSSDFISIDYELKEATVYNKLCSITDINGYKIKIA